MNLMKETSSNAARTETIRLSFIDWYYIIPFILMPDDSDSRVEGRYSLISNLSLSKTVLPPRCSPESGVILDEQSSDIHSPTSETD